MDQCYSRAAGARFLRILLRADHLLRRSLCQGCKCGDYIQHENGVEDGSAASVKCTSGVSSDGFIGANPPLGPLANMDE